MVSKEQAVIEVRSSEQMQAADRLVARFNNAVRLIVAHSGLTLTDAGELQRTAHANFKDALGIQVTVEIDPDLTVSIQRLKAKMVLNFKDERASVYQLLRQGRFSAKFERELVESVSAQMVSEGLSLKYKRAGYRAAMPAHNKLGVEVRKTTNPYMTAGEAQRGNIVEAREALGMGFHDLDNF